MGTKTIGITEEAYERLEAAKLEDESFTDTIERLLDTATSHWRHGFGRYAGPGGEDLDQLVSTARREHASGFARQQRDALEAVGIELDDAGNLKSTTETDGQ